MYLLRLENIFLKLSYSSASINFLHLIKSKPTFVIRIAQKLSSTFFTFKFFSTFVSCMDMSIKLTPSGESLTTVLALIWPFP